MFMLKGYQQLCLDELGGYFRRIIAFEGVTDVPESHLGSREDTTEKEAIGQLWEARSNGLCSFRPATKKNMREAILETVRRSA